MVVPTARQRQCTDVIQQAPDPDGMLRHVSRPRVDLVFRQLCTYANQDGICWPTIETVATDTGMGRRAVQAAMRFLRFVGLIERVRRRRVGGVWRSALTKIRRRPREWVMAAMPKAGDRPHRAEADQRRRRRAMEGVRRMLLGHAHTGAHRTPHQGISVLRTGGETPEAIRRRLPPDERTLAAAAKLEQIRRMHRESGTMARLTGNRRRK
jgi:hypothetical protein